MKFLLTGYGRQRKLFLWLSALFVLFMMCFWGGKWWLFYLNFRFSPANVQEHFLGTSDFPMPLSFTQLTETLHQEFFFYGMWLLLLGAFLLREPRPRLWLMLYLLLTLLSLFFLLSPIFIVLLTPKAASLYLITGHTLFLFYCLICIALLTGIFHKLINPGPLPQKNTHTGYLLLMWIVWGLGICLLGSAFALFHQKIGWNISSAEQYYLGKEELFLNPKDFRGLSDISIPHFMAIAIYLMTLMHFITMHHLMKLPLLLLAWISALLDNTCGFLIRYFSPHFIYLKYVAFLVFECSLALVLYLFLKMLCRK